MAVDEAGNRAEAAAVDLLEVAGESVGRGAMRTTPDAPSAAQDVRALDLANVPQPRPAERPTRSRLGSDLGEVANQQPVMTWSGALGGARAPHPAPDTRQVEASLARASSASG